MVVGSPVELSPYPVESDAISGKIESELSSNPRHPADV